MRITDQAAATASSTRVLKCTFPFAINARGKCVSQMKVRDQPVLVGPPPFDRDSLSRLPGSIIAKWSVSVQTPTPSRVARFQVPLCLGRFRPMVGENYRRRISFRYFSAPNLLWANRGQSPFE